MLDRLGAVGRPVGGKGGQEMATKEIQKVVQQEDITQKALTLALGILVERIQRLPREDRDELFQLVKELPNTETREEVESVLAGRAKSAIPEDRWDFWLNGPASRWPVAKTASDAVASTGHTTWT